MKGKELNNSLIAKALRKQNGAQQAAKTLLTKF